MGRSPKGLIEAARSAGAPIRRIALTHGHGDHVGLLDALRDSLGTRRGSADARARRADPRGRDGEGKFPGSWPKVRTRADRRLQPGDRVGSLEVVATPGHTPGHVAYLDTRDRAVIAGDTFTSYGRVMTSDQLRLPFPLAAAATWSGEQVLASAQTVRALAPSVMVVGHGPVVRDPIAKIDKALALAKAPVHA